MMKPLEKRENDDIEGFGDGDELTLNQERVVAFTPLNGLLTNNDKICV